MTPPSASRVIQSYKKAHRNTDRGSMKCKWAVPGGSVYIGLNICVLRPPDRESDTLLLDKGNLFASNRDVMGCVCVCDTGLWLHSTSSPFSED